MRSWVHGQSRFGFSLLELVFVMAIVTVSATIAFPRFARSQENYRAARAAGRLVNDFEYASTLARVTSTPVTIRFEKGDKPDESYYWFEGVEDPDHPDEVYTIVLRDDPYRVVLTEAPGDLEYRIDGTPKDSRTFVVVAGSAIRTVLVDNITGAVTIQ